MRPIRGSRRSMWTILSGRISRPSYLAEEDDGLELRVSGAGSTCAPNGSFKPCRAGPAWWLAVGVEEVAPWASSPLRHVSSGRVPRSSALAMSRIPNWGATILMGARIAPRHVGGLAHSPCACWRASP